MTITNIIVAVAPYKPMSRETLYNYFRRLKIKPLGQVRQIPVQYPDDTPTRILKALGVTPAKPTKLNRRQRSAA